MATREWKRMDRVCLVHAPELTGAVLSVDEDIVTVILDLDRAKQTVYAMAEDLDWYGPARKTYIEINAQSGFHYGYLAFFAHPERIDIERITVDGRTSLEAA